MYLFAGEQRDARLGLDYLRARYLDVTTGRFASCDTYPISKQTPNTLHRYMYSYNCPITFTDPSGLFSDPTGSYLGLGIAADLDTTIRIADTQNKTFVYHRVLGVLFTLGVLSLAKSDTISSSPAAKEKVLEEQKVLSEAIASVSTRQGCSGQEVFHYTDAAGAAAIVATQQLKSSPAKRYRNITHPAGAYATDVPPVGPTTRTDLQNMFAFGDANGFPATFFVMFCDPRFIPTGWPHEFYIPWPAGDFVDVNPILSGPNLMLP